MEDKVFVVKSADIKEHGEQTHPLYGYKRKCVIPDSARAQCVVSVYEIPPGKSAYPYHCHMNNTEVFYILSASGVLRCKSGEKRISAGDFAVCLQGENGAHKITNDSKTEPLVYIDFDTNNAPDVIHYPDSDKTGVVFDGKNTLFFDSDAADYYAGE